jgi:hypothetical protein
MEFRNTSFALAQAKTEATDRKVFAEQCIGIPLSGNLAAPTASMAKL